MATLNLPNQITISRLLIAAVFFSLLACFNVREPNVLLMNICFVLHVLAAGTDWLDGYLARKRNEVTSLGRILDPFVDKVLVCGAFVFFAGRGFVDVDGVSTTSVEAWMVVIIIGRELLVTGLRGYAESKGLEFGADTLGKIKTIIQLITAGDIMLNAVYHDVPYLGPLFGFAQVVLVWGSVIITAWSGINYVLKARPLFAGSA